MAVYDWDKVEAENVTELYRRKIAVGENLIVARVEAGRGSATRPHSHEHEEMVIVLQGCWRFHLPAGDVVLRANQLLTIPPGVEHSSEVLDDVIAIDVCSPTRRDWITGEDRSLHHDPDQWLWAI